MLGPWNLIFKYIRSTEPCARLSWEVETGLTRIALMAVTRLDHPCSETPDVIFIAQLYI